MSSGKTKIILNEVARYLTPQWLSNEEVIYRQDIDDNFIIKLLNTQSGNIKEIGSKFGVAYDIKVISPKQISYVYSDIENPISIIELDIDGNSIQQKNSAK